MNSYNISGSLKYFRSILKITAKVSPVPSLVPFILYKMVDQIPCQDTVYLP